MRIEWELFSDIDVKSGPWGGRFFHVKNVKMSWDLIINGASLKGATGADMPNNTIYNMTRARLFVCLTPIFIWWAQ